MQKSFLILTFFTAPHLYSMNSNLSELEKKTYPLQRQINPLFNEQGAYNNESSIFTQLKAMNEHIIKTIHNYETMCTTSSKDLHTRTKKDFMKNERLFSDSLDDVYEELCKEITQLPSYVNNPQFSLSLTLVENIYEQMQLEHNQQDYVHLKNKFQKDLKLASNLLIRILSFANKKGELYD